jgi:hypothetical protein
MKTLFLILSIAVLFCGCMPGAAALPTPTMPPERASIQFPETGPILRLSYDPALTGQVEAVLVDAVAYSPDLQYPLVHPAFVQFRFHDYAKNQTYQLPFPIEGPQMIAYRTQDFAGYENGTNRSYPRQWSSLQRLLEKGLDPDHCAAPLAGEDQALPFMPVVNAAQVFCAKPHMLAFEGGKGIRYITYYAQDIGPAVEWFVFYTFQGLTDDGQYYLAAILPLRTSILPNEPAAPGSEPDLNVQAALLRNQVAKINAQADDLFTPPLSSLDDLIAGAAIPGN